MASVLFVTDQWGYGTTTSAMSIAAALGRSHTRTLIGEGAGFALARRDSFDEHIPANTMTTPPPQALNDAVRMSDVVVSVMNVNAAQVADGLGVPCVYVDTLLWMWPQPPPLRSFVERYFAARFPGVERSLEQWRDQLPPTEIVAPLIAPSTRVDPRTHAEVVVNFGGLSSLLVPQGVLLTYARAMIECVVAALAAWPGKITVSVGQDVLDSIDRTPLHLARPDVRCVNLSHAKYLAELERSRLLVSSPGLNATHEAFARGIPCLLLPSQNLSQLLAVGQLRNAGPTFAMDWDVIYGLTDLTSEDEPRSCQRIADCFDRFQGDAMARAGLVQHLTHQLTADRLESIAAAQAAFFDQHRGEDGPKRVAAHVRSLASRRRTDPRGEPQAEAPLVHVRSSTSKHR